MYIRPESEKKDNNTNTSCLYGQMNRRQDLKGGNKDNNTNTSCLYGQMNRRRDLKGETKTTQDDERHSSNSFIVRMVCVCVNLYQSNYCCSQQVLQCASIILYCL